MGVDEPLIAGCQSRKASKGDAGHRLTANEPVLARGRWVDGQSGQPKVEIAIEVALGKAIDDGW